MARRMTTGVLFRSDTRGTRCCQAQADDQKQAWLPQPVIPKSSHLIKAQYASDRFWTQETQYKKDTLVQKIMRFSIVKNIDLIYVRLVHRRCDVHSTSSDFLSLDDFVRRPCSRCGAKTFLKSVVCSDQEPDSDIRTFECAICEFTEIKAMKYQPVT
jgi:hypothetical protein